VTVPHLASHILGRMARQVPAEWQRLYAHPVYLLETFVDPERFRGTCYRAANWVVVGRTTGRGKNDLTHKPNRSIKEVLAACASPFPRVAVVLTLAVATMLRLRRRLDPSVEQPTPAALAAFMLQDF
jgi:hypothetical protein